MSNIPFRKLVDQATEGLRGDHELLLDVRQELLGHLEESAAELAAETELTPEEVIEQTAAQFGSPVDVADQLFQANRGRMSQRNVARVLMCWVLVPVMLFAGLALGVLRLGAIQAAQRYSDGRPNDNSTAVKLPAYSIFAPPDYDMATLHKIDTPDNQRNRYRTDRFKEYWQQHQNEPEALHVLANFISSARVVFDPKRDIISKDPRGTSTYYDKGDIPPAEFMKFVAIGMKRDPDNALYPVIMAQLYFQKSIKSMSNRTTRNVIVHSKPDFDMGLKMVALAASKPRYRNYTEDYQLRMLQRLPQPRYFEQYLAREELARQLDLNWISLDRYMWNVVQYLGEQGDAAGCERVTQQFMKIELLYADSSPFNHHRASIYSTGMGILKMCQLSVEKSHPTAFTQEIAKLSKSPAGDSYSGVIALNPSEQQALASAKTIDIIPYFTTYITANFAGVQSDQLIPLKRLQSVLAAETLIMYWQSAFAILLILSTLLAIIWSITGAYRGQRVLFLMPDWARLRIILLCCVFIPGVIVAAAAEFGWIHHAAIMWVIPALLLIMLPTIYEWIQTRLRCHELGIKTPDMYHELIATIVGYGCFILGLALYLYMDHTYGPLASVFTMLMFVFGWSMMVGSVIIGLYAMSHFVRYFSALNRRLAGLWAGSILVLSLLITPWMLSREATWLRRDTLWLGYLGAPGGVKQIEGRFAQNLSRFDAQRIDDSIRQLMAHFSSTGDKNRK